VCVFGLGQSTRPRPESERHRRCFHASVKEHSLSCRTNPSSALVRFWWCAIHVCTKPLTDVHIDSHLYRRPIVIVILKLTLFLIVANHFHVCCYPVAEPEISNRDFDGIQCFSAMQWFFPRFVLEKETCWKTNFWGLKGEAVRIRRTAPPASLSLLIVLGIGQFVVFQWWPKCQA